MASEDFHGVHFRRASKTGRCVLLLCKQFPPTASLISTHADPATATLRKSCRRMVELCSACASARAVQNCLHSGLSSFGARILKQPLSEIIGRGAQEFFGGNNAWIIVRIS